MSQSLRQLKENFAETHPPLSEPEAIVEATRCLYCFDAPCTRACPTHIDIPRFIRQIMHRDPVSSAKTILDSNIFGGSCARVCPTEVLCAGACVDNTLLKEPVRIGALQRFACDTAFDESMSFYHAGESSGKSVAIVGAGPAGLTCAHELRKRGHRVVVYEAKKTVGGLNTLGIAAYKQDTTFATKEARRVTSIGMEMKLGKPVTAKVLGKLLDEYDAVFLGVGLGKTAALEIPGENLKSVWESLDFIAQTHTKPYSKCTIGETVIVIGGGNTAVDAARAALRLGATSVTMAYRRDMDSMPAFTHEVDDAVAEGINIELNAMPLKMVGKSGRVTGVQFVRTKLDGKGRKAKLKAVRGSEFTIEADMVIKALGQEPLLDLLEAIPKLKLSPNGRIVIDPKTSATSVSKLFAGGDAVYGAKEEVVNAVQSGKVAAAGIHSCILRG